MAASVAEQDSYSNLDGVVPDKATYRPWLKALRIAIDSKYHGDVYEAFLGMEAPIFARAFYQVQSHPNGRKLFKNKPDLLAVLGDEEYLASLPFGSLGHAYLSFLKTNKLDAGVFGEAGIIRPIAEKNNWSDDFYYMIVRATALHDMFHVIGGYGPDAAGEVANVGFHCGQMEPAGPLEKIGRLGALLLPGTTVRFRLRYYQQAVERGRRADLLMAAPWEELLEKPYHQVQEILGVEPAAVAHPQGRWTTRWMPPSFKPPTLWDYEEILAAGPEAG
ncbi:Coq4 family protein [Mycolicibacterium llatzerense]|uniref:Coq4 family protein n=1 Tax=Mycolicibacterium llatzerense TaxID=280871 RepID=UPI0008DE37D6|nr:Coq4 family protein [Mycolicibacterium llatzerense]